MTTTRLGLVALLIVLGTGWGLTQPLSKIAVSEGYRHFGLIVWQLAIAAVLLGAITFLRGRRLPLTPHALRIYTILALIGTVLPNAMSYEVARFLPAGWLSVIISTVPLVAFPIALWLGTDQFDWGRMAGLVAGLMGVIVLALPVQAWLTGTAAPDALPPHLLIWLAAGLVAPTLYAMEANYVSSWGIGGLDPIQALFGASLVGVALALPLALATGTWIDPRPPWGAPDAALVASAVIHAAVYSGYVWMVGRAGAVFASQVSYVVTGAGVGWAMLLLGERYGAGFWVAFALLLMGLFLVRPREPMPAP